jgi:hypothetical protein
MPETAIPEDVRTLLLEHIHTHEQLEALLLMHADPTRDWNVQQLADTLKIASSSTAGSLASGSLYLDVD